MMKDKIISKLQQHTIGTGYLLNKISQFFLFIMQRVFNLFFLTPVVRTYFLFISLTSFFVTCEFFFIFFEKIT